MAVGRERGSISPSRRGAPLLRAPEARPPAPPPPSDRPLLRLAVSRGLLGIELDAPWNVGPLRVIELQAGLPGVRFPVDLTGGVARFRHRRGALSRLVLEIPVSELVAWAAPRLRGLFGEAIPELVLAPIEAGVLVGIRHGATALAFDAVLAPIDGALRILPERARGVGLGAPPQVLAMRALGAIVGALGHAVGSAILIPNAAAQLAREVLPAAGARAPSAASMRWDVPVAELGRFVLEARDNAAPPELSDRSLRALELAELAGEADASAFAGDLDDARHRYLAVLERAPRHPEVSQRLAWIDAVTGGRAEGALSTLVDALPAVDTGALGGQLLAAVGDHDGARVALARGARAEPYGTLAALLWLAHAQLGDEERDVASLAERLDALDHAVARAPALDLVRWARLELRLDLADLRGAKADIDHLEAAARGADARHAVFRRAAAAFLARGLLVDSASLFERALRYAPDNVDAVIGLARSLRAAGRDRRALDLFARAVALAGRQNKPAHAAELELARALAELAGDRPAAVARVRAVPPGLPESFEARFLEGRWRAELGDLAGASLAFGRLRDAVDLAPDLDVDRRTAIAAMLVEAAAIEERERSDYHATQRLLGLALRLRPRDRAIAADFRRVATLALGPTATIAPPPRAATPEAASPIAPIAAPIEPPAAPIEISPAPPPILFDSDAPDAPSDASAEDEALAQTLTDRLRGDPDDHATAMELAAVLERLGRDLDLLSLLSARMDEGDDDARAEVTPLRRAVLLRLARVAREGGRASEAELYEMMADQEPE